MQAARPAVHGLARLATRNVLLRRGIRTVTPAAHSTLRSAPAAMVPTLPSRLTQTRRYSAEAASAEATSAEATSAETTATPEAVKADNKEVVTSDAKHHVFKTETQKLLHIVANSLYSEKEVFVRELVSNAADALEKLRYQRTLGQTAEMAADSPLEIRLYVDPEAKTFILQDTGIGMNEEELNSHLGTIARSGSKSFIEQLDADGQSSSSARDKIIGQFGVGFYSAFMVGDKVEVFTRSAMPDSKGYCWTSDGLGAYTIAEADNVDVGTKIVIHLRDNCLDYAKQSRAEEIITKHSNFVGFPIFLNGDKINTIEALWTMDKNSITDEQHKEFYRFIASAWDMPRFRLHYKTDAPLSINSLLYVPENHAEQFGMERMEPGVSLYSRKVLIKAKSDALLPAWLRFVKGVVDSEDIPLNLSREMLQDSALIGRLRNVMTQRICKWLLEESRRDPEKYENFVRNFSVFLKEGVCTDTTFRSNIAELLRFESSTVETGKLTSFKQYIERMPASQSRIFYLCTANRQFAEDSPYYEPFKQKGIEVLFLYDSVDEFVMSSLQKFDGKELVSIDSDAAASSLDNLEQPESTGTTLTAEEGQELTRWMLAELSTAVRSVKISKRLVSHPAVVVNPESATMRRMMEMISSANKSVIMPTNPVELEINPSHPIIYGLFHARTADPTLAKQVAEQLVANAQIAAGSLSDPRSMLHRLNSLLEVALKAKVTGMPESNEQVKH